MNKFSLSALLFLAAGSLAASPLYAASVQSEPDNSEYQIVHKTKAKDMKLEPTEQDFLKAREARKKARRSNSQTYVSERGTKIQSYTDQNHQMTHVKVTPTETEIISYTMKNKANRPMDNGGTTNTRSTLGTPQFLQFTW